MADSDVSPPGLASAQPPSRTIRLDLGKAGWMYLYFLTIVFAYIILTLTGHEIGVRWLFGGADTQQILGISPANDFLYILSILMVIALIGVILYFRSLRADATNRTDLSRSLTTFSISIIGVLVLWGIFLFIIGLDENVTADDAFQLAGLVISPLGTIIGFVAGQSAGAAGAVNGGFGLLLDAQWGLFIAAPVMAFAIAAVPQWLRGNRRAVLVTAAAVAPYLALVAAYKVWWGEWGPPARYLVPIVPLTAGALGAWLSRASILSRSLVAVTWAAGMLLTLIGYADPQRFYHHPDGVNKLVGELHRATHLGFDRLLVPFQPYSPGTLAERFWISLCALAGLFLLAWAIGSVPNGLRRRITRTIRLDRPR